MKDIRLEFRLRSDAPPEFIGRWLRFRKECQGGRVFNTNITKLWLEKCKLLSNQHLPISDKYNGGIGEGLHSKRITFESNSVADLDSLLLSMKVESSIDGEKLWTFKELSDLIIAFQWVANRYVKEECVVGRIAIYPIEEDAYLSAGRPEVKDIVFC